MLLYQRLGLLTTSCARFALLAILLGEKTVFVMGKQVCRLRLRSAETLAQSIIRIINDEYVRFRLRKNDLNYADEFS